MGGKARPARGTDRYVVVEWLRSSWRILVGKRVIFDGYATRNEAVLDAREFAQLNKLELVVKSRNGRIRWRNSYGNDSPRRHG